MISGRASLIQESATVSLGMKAKELKRLGHDVISLAIGQPDVDTPEVIKEEAIKALKEGKTKYVSSRGIEELRREIVNYYGARGIKASLENVVIAPTKLMVYLSLLAICDPGDRVGIPDPGWVSYKWQAYLGGLIPETYGFEKDFEPNLEEIERLGKLGIRALILNTPANPTGAVFKKKTMEELFNLAEKYGFYIISDETYEELVFDGKHVSIGEIDESFDRSVLISGLSKTASMTGWRIGWILGKKELADAINRLIQHTITCATSFAQYGAVKAFSEDVREFTRKMREEYRRRSEIAMKWIEKTGWECVRPKGTFYVFPKYNKDLPSFEVSKKLLEEKYVVVTPGKAFGERGECHIRISCATDPKRLEEGLRRIYEFWRNFRSSSKNFSDGAGAGTRTRAAGLEGPCPAS